MLVMFAFSWHVLSMPCTTVYFVANMSCRSITRTHLQILSMSELVKAAIAEAQAFDKQGPSQDAASGEASADVPLKLQLARAAQTSLQVRLC